MEQMAPVTDPMLEGSTALGIGAAWYERAHKGRGAPYPRLAELDPHG
jgi:hypothetical protein